MTNFILKTGRYVRAGGIVVQVLGLVVAITEHIAGNQRNAEKANDPTEGE
jgi:hypothetical protein